MKTVCNAVGIAGLCVFSALGQGAKPDPSRPADPVPALAPVATQDVVRATHAGVAAAPLLAAPATNAATAAAPVAAPPISAPVVAAPPLTVAAETPSQAVAQAVIAPVVTPFTVKYTGRTSAGITNALIRWGAWAPGAKEGDPRFPTERAVLAALNWLQREQRADGSWQGSKEVATPALTALALLDYLGHGETPASAAYGPTVHKAIHWLQADQEPGGGFAGRDDRDYTHPMAALALAEAYGMTLDPDLKAAAEKAVVRIVKAQHPSGGFSYNLDKESRDDTSYMCWCAQALAVSRMAKLDVPGLERALERASYAIRQNADPHGGFGESAPGRTALSSAGLLGLQFLGEPRVAEAQKTLDLLSTNTFSYAAEEAPLAPGASRFLAAWNLTQARFQAGGESFRTWNKSLARELTGSQIRQRNSLTGWKDLGRWERPGANEPKEVVIQDTCTCALMLEVYYRYLPVGK